MLFNHSLFYNIAYGRPDSSPDHVFAAIKAASLDRLIKDLPDKLETIVGERGLKLSGGEKQRVAIARALLKNPPLMLFDEATSSLDSQTEQEIQHHLLELAHNKTTIIIAHRLSTIAHADVIIVLDHGRIVAQGTHASLLAEPGIYANLWQKQLEGNKKH